MKKTLWRGSTLQSLAVIVLPLTVLLVVVSFVSFSVHQNAMRSMVGERDERSARSAASAIETEINHRLYEVRSLALLASSNPQESPGAILGSSESLMGDFDYGTALFEQAGTLLATSGGQGFWQKLVNTPELKSVFNPVNDNTISAVFASPTDGKQVVLVSSRTANGKQIAVAAFSPEALIASTLQGIYPVGGDTAIYIIDSSFQTLYHGGPATLEGALESHPGVSEAFKGQSGTTYMKVGRDEHVVAFSPIRTVGWALSQRNPGRRSPARPWARRRSSHSSLSLRCCWPCWHFGLGQSRSCGPCKSWNRKQPNCPGATSNRSKSPSVASPRSGICKTNWRTWQASSRRHRRACTVISARSPKDRKPSGYAWHASCTMTPSSP